MANRKIYSDEFIHQLLYEKAQGPKTQSSIQVI